MTEPTKRYVIAEKRSPSTEPPAPLHDMLNTVDGVEILGVTNKRAEVKATAAGAESLRSNMGDWLHVEEIADRDLP